MAQVQANGLREDRAERRRRQVLRMARKLRILSLS
jgi:hypothetical protein